MTHVLVLTGSAPLDLKAVVAAADAAGAGRPVALAPEAAEAPLPDGDPERLARARAALGVAAVDVNAVPAARRRKRLLVADMDSTIIGCECIDEIADMVGIGPHVSAITERAMRGELNFESALAERVALLKGVTEDLLLRVFDERVRLNPGASTLVRTMREGGADTALVSGGFTFFARRVADEAGFAQHFASHLEIIGGQLTGRVLPPIVGREGKAARLRALAEAGGYSLAETLAVGDGANDLMMLGEAGLGVAYRAKPAVAAAAHARIEHGDLTALLHLQGIPVAEWVR